MTDLPDPADLPALRVGDIVHNPLRDRRGFVIYAEGDPNSDRTPGTASHPHASGRPRALVPVPHGRRPTPPSPVPASQPGALASGEPMTITPDDDDGSPWANGYRSGYGEGRKAASTDKMLGVFRVFDPRPLQAALAEFDDEPSHTHTPAATRLAAVMRQALADAQVEP